MKIKVGIKIMPREVILDTQGRAVEKTLQLNNQKVEACRVGRFVELEIEATNQNEAKSKAETITKLVLHNPLLENYEIIL